MNCQWTRQISELAIWLIQAIHGMVAAAFFSGSLAVILWGVYRWCRLERVCDSGCIGCWIIRI